MKNKFLKPTNPKLRKVSKEIPLSKINSSKIKDVIKRMLEIAYGEQGNPEKPIMVGLAAPQIGISKKIILVDLKADGKGKVGDVKVFINPEITWSSLKKGDWYEGCYSVPNICGIVSRSASIKIKAHNLDGKKIEQNFKGYIARIFQHEIDHLNGKFFFDLITNPTNLHLVKPEDFILYRNKKMWKNWPKKAPFPLAYSRLKKV